MSESVVVSSLMSTKGVGLWCREGDTIHVCPEDPTIRALPFGLTADGPFIEEPGFWKPVIGGLVKDGFRVKVKQWSRTAYPV